MPRLRLPWPSGITPAHREIFKARSISCSRSIASTPHARGNTLFDGGFYFSFGLTPTHGEAFEARFISSSRGMASSPYTGKRLSLPPNRSDSISFIPVHRDMSFSSAQTRSQSWDVLTLCAALTTATFCRLLRVLHIFLVTFSRSHDQYRTSPFLKYAYTDQDAR